ncbi:SnoaL-like domain protein [Posidoniimonas polymericola]|uniref:SnoaL-like domain protein n=1 Tax=Posidoniimonas polymericola TaxID=2528002 RepID=A0A5C5XZI1_9BACT|nr:SgcJ/EcaC family oxidoreductase [Posidoniimonas polymericola]TWT66892.1 SnoaL-like domain protein [Posidoniimonas polymericola]
MKRLFSAALLALTPLSFFCHAAAADDNSAAGVADAVSERLSAYLTAFNDHDADAVAAFWAEDGVSTNEETGERVTGRDAIRDDLAAFFSDNPAAKLTGEVTEVRSVHPEVAIAEGVATLFLPETEPTPSAFTAVMAKTGGQWLLESSGERPLPTPESSATALEELSWLIGRWQDDTEGVAVDTTVRWSPNKAFLIRSYRAEYDDGGSFEGTQVIGWHPLDKSFRTWSFNSDGSFGEGVASRSGDEWLLKSTDVHSDGVVSTYTQVIRPVDEQTLEVQKIGRTEDGAPLPSTEPITVRRAPDAALTTEQEAQP